MNTLISHHPAKGLWLLWITLLFHGSLVLAQDQNHDTPSDHQHETEVYITRTGKKYHLESCGSIRYSGRIIQLDSAVALGYGACMNCKPPSPMEEVETKGVGKSKVNASEANQRREPAPRPRSSLTIRCSAYTLKGTRCKRNTQNESGKCWQHE